MKHILTYKMTDVLLTGGKDSLSICEMPLMELHPEIIVRGTDNATCDECVRSFRAFQSLGKGRR